MSRQASHAVAVQSLPHQRRSGWGGREQDAFPGLTPLELSSGVVVGGHSPERLSETVPAPDPLSSLEQAILPALSRPPCLVSFSGGRDSSAILAVATLLARRHGLMAPVPITYQWVDALGTDETSWQAAVVKALGIDDWVRLQMADQLDVIGPVFKSALQRHGCIWPPSLYMASPLLEHAAGGSFLTGNDGDAVFGAWRWTRLSQVARRQVRPVSKDLLRLGLACGPARVRAKVILRRAPHPALFWLRREARAEVLWAWALSEAEEPVRWNERLRWLAGRRYIRLLTLGYDVMGKANDVEVHHPLIHPGFLASLAAQGGILGYGSRTAAMGSLFGGVLPQATIQRRTKAIFDEAIFRGPALSFARSWNGEGLDENIVDAEALKRHWSEGRPHARTAALLQQAWIAQKSPDVS